MIARLFIYIYDRTSYGFAVAIFTTTWSWVASFYGFFFVHATVNFTSGRELSMITAGADYLHRYCDHSPSRFISACSTSLGFQGFTRTIRLINRYFEKKYIFVNYKTIDSREIEEVYSAVSSLPIGNLLTGSLCATVTSLFDRIYYLSSSGIREKYLC